MTIGSLTAKVVLDQPARIHCGTEDVVTGNVLLTYQPSPPSDVDLFGPLEVVVTFHGRAKTKLRIRRGKQTHIYRGRAPLLEVARRIHNGPFRAAPNTTQSFPFSFTFPAAVNALFSGEWKADPRFDTRGLPPTMSMNYYGFVHHFDCFTEYRIGATARMPNIDVKVNNVGEDDEAHVLYEQPRTPAHAVRSAKHQAIADHLAIQNEYLLPEADRPNGFKQRTKALFKSDFYPRYPFDLHTSVPKHVYLGQPIVLEIMLKTFPEQSTAVVIPEIVLSAVNVTLESLTEVRATLPALSFSEPSSYGTESWVVLGGAQPPRDPFSKANDYTKIVRTSRLANVPSTFSTFNILRTYTIKIKFVLTGAGKSFNVAKEYPIVIHPPVDEGTTGSSPVAGPSATTHDPTAEGLPLYQTSVQAGPSSGPRDSMAPLPNYEEAAPEYTSSPGVQGGVKSS